MAMPWGELKTCKTSFNSSGWSALFTPVLLFYDLSFSLQDLSLPTIVEMFFFADSDVISDSVRGCFLGDRISGRVLSKWAFH